MCAINNRPRRWVALLGALVLCLDLAGFLRGGPATAFGAIEQIRPISQVTRDSYGLPIRFPSALFFDAATNETYLVTGGKGQLSVFAEDLYPLATAGPGRGIYTPQGGAIDGKGQVYICQSPRDGRPSRITVLNGALISVREISFDKIPQAADFVPRRMAVSRDGLIYVASQHRGVMVLDNGGAFLRWLQPRDKVSKRSSAAAGEKPAGEGKAAEDAAEQAKAEALDAEAPEEPPPGSGGPPDSEDASGLRPVLVRGVTIDSVGNIYLVSSETGKIYVFGPDEGFLFSFGTKGGTPGRLSQPRGVAVDRERGLMFVADYMRHTILAYALDGTYLFEFGGKGEAPGWYKFPTDILVNKRGELIISDLFNHRLQMLEVKYQKDYPSLQELKGAAPPAKPAPDAGSAAPAEPAAPPAPAVQPAAGGQEPSPEPPPPSPPDAEVKEQVIPAQAPASPDDKAQ